MLKKQQNGFTMVELMVSMVIGLFLLAGVFTIYLNGRESQKVVDEEVRMMDNARFALETISFDLRHAGAYGHHNHEDKINIRALTGFEVVTSQCGGAAVPWVVDIDKPVYAVNDSTDFLTSCMADWDQGDTLEVRYAAALPMGVVEADLVANALYLKSVSAYAYMFKGDTPPAAHLFTDQPDVRYFMWQSRGYYISDHTDQVGDGMPSLRLVALEPGPIVNNTVLLRGVEDMQVQFGLDIPLVGETQGDESADTYEHPAIGINWNQAISARVWLVIRSEKQYPEIDPLSTYEVAGVARINGDRFKRTVVSTSVRLRNVNTGDY